MIDPMEFPIYDKVSDDIFVIGPNAILKFNVSLSKILNDGRRFHFYKEFKYSSKAIEYPELITIKRSFDYYLSIENMQKTKDGDTKAFIRIGPNDYFKLKNQIDEVYSWFTDKKFKNLFARDKGKLILTSPIPESVVSGYPQNKFIRFTPAVVDYNEGHDVMRPGVEMDLSSYDNYVIMDIDRFMGLHYTISTFNMYLAAQGLVDYMGLPGGMNRFSIQEHHQINIVEDTNKEPSASIGRTFGKKNISSLE